MELIPLGDVEPCEEHYLHLEQGNILFFPRTPFHLSEADGAALRAAGLSSGRYHKNIAYRPASERVTGFDKALARDLDEFRGLMRAYSQWALAFLHALLPRYMENCRVDFASFRPMEEQGRDLPTAKRNDLLHVDAFPTRPTGGDLILRVFTNVNTKEPRVWMVSDAFERLAKRYAMDAGLARIAKPRFLDALRFGSRSSPYDRFMLGFHDYLKFNRDYQENCPKYRFEFPAGSTWIVFTDIVPHAVLSGQFALEQTVIVRRDSLARQQQAPISILEALCHRSLGRP